jgi:hypothetical protein
MSFAGWNPLTRKYHIEGGLLNILKIRICVISLNYSKPQELICESSRRWKNVKSLEENWPD